VTLTNLITDELETESLQDDTESFPMVNWLLSQFRKISGKKVDIVS